MSKCEHPRIAHCGSLYACMDCGKRGDAIKALWFKTITEGPSGHLYIRVGSRGGETLTKP